ncbi:MAG: Maf family nucleotide pyrophosphatase [Kiritimatiellae bacterium]|nr:Maf family nucleotide pyrophosphatase [Kiritimatiellia bacterium]
MPPPYQHLFGPVASRRFGRSLGVDLQADGVKRCTLSCVFCQLGPTPATTIERRADVPIEKVLAELDDWKRLGGTADFITLAGSGEPTLHPRFGEVFDWVRRETAVRSLLLSNGSLFTLDAVRRDAARADVVKVSLHAWDAASFARIARPHPSLAFDAIVEGYRRFRAIFAGELIVEVFIVPGLNDLEWQADRIAALLRDVAPDRIQLNSAARPPADSSVRAVSPARLRELAQRFTPAAETPEAAINATSPPPRDPELAEAVAALVRRHPADLGALCATFGQDAASVRALLHDLAAEGRIALALRDNVWHAGPPVDAATVVSVPPLLLASASPRRRKLLAELGLAFEVLPVSAPEIHDPSDPVGTVARNAVAKHDAARALRPDAVLIAADTLVWFEGRLIGKPADLEDAAKLLRAFSGRTQTVFTAVALSMPGQAPDLRIEASCVHFRKLEEAVIQEYLKRTKPLDRAGAYDIDENGDLLIAGYDGSYSNIMGLPVESVRDWLRAQNYDAPAASGR